MKKLKTCIKSDWCKAYMSKNYDKGKYECVESKICNDFINRKQCFICGKFIPIKNSYCKKCLKKVLFNKKFKSIKIKRK